MRAYTSNILSAWKKGRIKPTLIVSVYDGSKWIDLTSYYSKDYVISATINDDIDTNVMDAEVHFTPNSYNFSVSPFVYSNSPLQLYRKIKIEVKINPSSSTVNIFEGYIDAISVGTDSIKVQCRDYGALLIDRYIEEEREYGNDNGSPLETEMQKILDDNLGTDVVTLYTPVSPNWYVKKWKQEKVSLMEALQKLADQIGWCVRYRYSNNQWRLTLYEPNRSLSNPSLILDDENILEFSELSQDIADVRNYIRIRYLSNNQIKSYDAYDSDSIALYGRRYMEVSEGKTSNIDTEQEAQRMAQAILNDLKEPKYHFSVLIPFFPYIELYDVIQFTKGINYTSDMIFSVVSLTHDISPEYLKTELKLSGKPCGQFKKWLVLDNRIEGPQPIDVTPPNPPTGLTATPTIRGIIVTLNPNTEEDFEGYEIHVSEQQGFTPNDSTLKAKGKNTRFDILNLVPNKTYYIKAIAYDKAGNKSQPSVEVSATAGQATSNDMGASVITFSNLSLDVLREIYTSFENDSDGDGIPDGFVGESYNGSVSLVNTCYRGNKAVRLYINGSAGSYARILTKDFYNLMSNEYPINLSFYCKTDNPNITLNALIYWYIHPEAAPFIRKIPLQIASVGSWYDYLCLLNTAETRGGQGNSLCRIGLEITTSSTISPSEAIIDDLVIYPMRISPLFSDTPLHLFAISPPTQILYQDTTERTLGISAGQTAQLYNITSTNSKVKIITRVTFEAKANIGGVYANVKVYSREYYYAGRTLRNYEEEYKSSSIILNTSYTTYTLEFLSPSFTWGTLACRLTITPYSSILLTYKNLKIEGVEGIHIPIL